MKILYKIFLLFIFFHLSSCGLSKLGTAEDARKAKLMSGSVDEIIAKSGTTFRSTESAMKDAKNRLNTGGGLMGEKPMSTDALLNGDKNNISTATIGLPINAILWRSSLDIINFMPLSSADPFAGVIITDWYSPQKDTKERCKVNIFIKGKELKSSNLKVNSFCQNLNNNLWIDMPIDEKNNLQIENAILNKAKKLKLSIN